MKFKKNLLVVSGLGLTTLVALPLAVACAPSESKPKDPAPITDTKLSIKEKLAYLANVWNTQSAEKDAMALTQFTSAKKAYDAMKAQSELETNKVSGPETGKKYMNVQNPTDGKFVPVVFMDLDETVLNNYAFQNWTLLNNTGYNSALWREFVEAKVSTEVKGAIDFIRHVWNNGGVVMYNSNRDQDQWEATKQNMIKLGLEEKYLPDYASWMKGVDLEDARPWSLTKRDENKKIVSSQKEARMNLVSSGKAFDLSEHDGGNAVKFRTIMRVGDNFDDFNDNASKRKSNADRIKVLEKTGKLFGNFDTNVKGVKWDKDSTTGKIVETAETWSESYVMIGGNIAYGGFEEGIKENWFKLSATEQVTAMETVLKTLVWTGPKKLTT